MPGGPVERVQGHSAVEPAGRVPGVEGVRQWRQQILAHAGPSRARASILAADKSSGSSEVARPPIRDSASVRDPRGSSRWLRVSSTSPSPTSVGGDLIVEDPLSSPRARRGSLRGGHAARALRRRGRAGRRTKSEWSRLAFSHPQHVVEQQLVAVVTGSGAGGRVRERREDLAEGADFGVDAE